MKSIRALAVFGMLIAACSVANVGNEGGRPVEQKSDKKGLIKPVFDSARIEKPIVDRPVVEPPVMESVFRQELNVRAFESFASSKKPRYAFDQWKTRRRRIHTGKSGGSYGRYYHWSRGVSTPDREIVY